MQPGNPPRPGWGAPRPPMPGRGSQRPPAPEQAEATQVVRVPPAPPVGPPDLFELLGVGDPASIDVNTTWRPRDMEDAHRTPLGIGPDGVITWLDFRTSGFEIGGGTPEQRSELLRNILIGLAVRRSSNDVQFLCLSPTGSLDGVEYLPHTNLYNHPDEPALKRFTEALRVALTRQFQVLDAGFPRHRAYEHARRNGAELAPMPLLVLAVDDIHGRYAANPEFQKVLRELDDRSEFSGIVALFTAAECSGRFPGRVVLRTGFAEDSRRRLDQAGAETLAPGEALLYEPRIHDAPHRFRAASCSLPYGDHTTWDIAVRGLDGRGPTSPPILAAPLIASNLADYLPPPTVVAGRGLCCRSSSEVALTPIIGTVDLLDRHAPLRLDLTGYKQTAVVGKPRSGKSTTIRTLLLSMALTHAPDEVRFHCLDFGGGRLDLLGELPHTRVVTGGYDDGGRIARATRELLDLLRARERLFAQGGIEWVDDFEVEAPGARHHVLVVDGWSELAYHAEASVRVLRLARRGAEYGIHVVITADRWDDLPRELRDRLDQRIELALAAPEDSRYSPQLASEITQPGQALVDHRRCVIAKPELNGSPVDLALGISAAWPHARPPQLGRPPELVRYEELPASQAKLRLPLGVGDDREPVSVDLTGDLSPHLLITGGRGAGRSTALRVLIKGITTAFKPSEAMIMVVDLERAHHANLTGSHTLASNRDNEEFGRDLRDVVQALRKRLPAEDVTPRQRHDRSWWTGPELFVIIDDYEQLWKSSTRTFVEFVHQAHEIELHLIIATGPNRPDLLLSTLAAAGAQQLVLGPADAVTPWMSDPAWPQPKRPGEAVHAELPRGRVNGPLRVAWLPDPLTPDAEPGDG